MLALDFDGVIVDSEAAKRQAFDDVFELYPEHAPALRELRNTDLSANRVSFFNLCVQEVFGAETEPEARFTTLMSQLSDAMTRRVAACPAISGVAAFLDRHAHLPQYLVSLTPIDNLRAILEQRQLLGQFRGYFGRPPYSKEEAFRTIIESEAIPPESLLVIGDSLSDAESAAMVGAQFAGLAADERFAQTGFPYAGTLDEISELIENG